MHAFALQISHTRVIVSGCPSSSSEPGDAGDVIVSSPSVPKIEAEATRSVCPYSILQDPDVLLPLGVKQSLGYA